MTDANPSPGKTRVVTASEFRARCPALMDEVADNGGEIIITKRGKPVARLVQHRERKQLRHGAGRGRMKILGDIVSPLYPNYPDDSDSDDDINVPAEPPTERRYLRFGAGRDQMRILGDIVSPLYPNFPDDLEPYEDGAPEQG